ncbi:unnamed protein product [Linum trigynum]|uniref:Reverse transcriptase zinc-binding domain-containing protein n=1 Tax=Linum trigynum TaxID=586398 RepID=A0AAV2FS71_9ROSI
MKKRSIPWRKGDVLNDPKGEGGLGFRNFQLFNMALVAKQGWRLITEPNALWARLMKGLYYPNGDFLTARKGSTSSWIWSSLWESRKALDLGTIRVIGSGEDTWFHKDPWVHPIQGHTISSLLDPPSRVRDWMCQDGKRWNMNLIHRHCSPEEADVISRIQIGPNGAPDKWVWKFNSTGSFSVRTAYHGFRNHLKEVNQPMPNDLNLPADDDKWKWLWSLNLPPKIRFFMWRCIRNALATKLNLFRRKCSPNTTCQLCNGEEESPIHCLFLCSHAEATWRTLFPSNVVPQNISQWIFSLREEGNGEVCRQKIFCLWNIWKARNEFVFKGVVPSPTRTSIFAFREAAEPHLTPFSSSTFNQPREIPSLSCPPPFHPQQRIYCDGSFDVATQEAAFGVVITNSDGQIWDGKAGRIICSSPIEAEARAILDEKTIKR